MLQKCAKTQIIITKNKFHLEKLFDPDGPYSKNKHFIKEKKSKSKRRNRKKSNQPNSFIKRNDNIDKEDLNFHNIYGIASLFEDPSEKEVRLQEVIDSNKRKKGI